MSVKLWSLVQDRVKHLFSPSEICRGYTQSNMDKMFLKDKKRNVPLADKGCNKKITAKLLNLRLRYRFKTLAPIVIPLDVCLLSKILFSAWCFKVNPLVTEGKEKEVKVQQALLRGSNRLWVLPGTPVGKHWADCVWPSENHRPVITWC